MHRTICYVYPSASDRLPHWKQQSTSCRRHSHRPGISLTRGYGLERHREAFERTFAVGLRLTVMSCHFLVGQFIALLKTIASVKWLEKGWEPRETTEKLNPESGIVSSFLEANGCMNLFVHRLFGSPWPLPSQSSVTKKNHQQQVRQVWHSRSVYFQWNPWIRPNAFSEGRRWIQRLRFHWDVATVGLVPPKSVELFAVRLPFWSKPCGVPA